MANKRRAIATTDGESDKEVDKVGEVRYCNCKSGIRRWTGI